MRRLFISILAIASINLNPMNVMASDRPSSDRLAPLPNNTLIAKGLRIPKVGHTNASSQLRRFKPLKLSTGKLAWYLGKNDMRKILTSHTVKAYNRKKHPAKETFFGKRAKAKNIAGIMRGIFKQNGSKILKNYQPNQKRTDTYTYKGKNYEVGYNKNRHIRHFYPKK
jgi:hypothetical protein